MSAILKRIAFLFLIVLLPVIARAEQPVTSVELLKDASFYNAKKIIFEGEVVGDIMIRGKSGWINVNDGGNAIGVFAAANFLKDIDQAGRYGKTGDLVQIFGVFNRSCTEH